MKTNSVSVKSKLKERMKQTTAEKSNTKTKTKMKPRNETVAESNIMNGSYS